MPSSTAAGGGGKTCEMMTVRDKPGASEEIVDLVSSGRAFSPGTYSTRPSAHAGLYIGQVGGFHVVLCQRV